MKKVVRVTCVRWMMCLFGRALRQLEERRRQQRVAEITEMIHVASLMHDDVIDTANTRRGLQALNSVFGNKVRLVAAQPQRRFLRLHRRQQCSSCSVP